MTSSDGYYTCCMVVDTGTKMRHVHLVTLLFFFFFDSAFVFRNKQASTKTRRA